MKFYFSANEDYGVLRILKMNVAKAGYETLPRILELKVWASELAQLVKMQVTKAENLSLNHGR